MTLIRTTCPRCGEVELGPEAISLSVGDADEEPFYRFQCPACRESVLKRADSKIVALLVSAGVGLEARGSDTGRENGDSGSEPTELLITAPGPPFTLDDLLDFHLLLQDDARLTRALHSGCLPT
jgi:predicted RNA-binding Zn-ribbon protein involved in translation (DUF1610 family)